MSQIFTQCLVCDQELKKKVAETCVNIHQEVAKATQQFWEELRRHYYITPSSYMELIRIYSRMLNEQKTEFMNNRYCIFLILRNCVQLQKIDDLLT